MNKLVISIVIVAVLAIAFGTAGFVLAQTPTPQTPIPGSGYGQGMMNGQGYRGGMMNGQGNRGGMMYQNDTDDQDGPLHDTMMAVFAEKLGIPVDELTARMAKGETMAQIATTKGLTTDQFRTLMLDARNQAIDQAVKDGTLTTAQADAMKQRGAGPMQGQGMGGGRGMRGMSQGQFANPNCPYTQTNP